MPQPSRTVIADRGDEGRRVDLVIRRHVADVEKATRTRIQSWIEQGRVTLNGRPVRKVATRVMCGDALLIAMPDQRLRMRTVAEEIPLVTLFEDDYLLAINKPAGITVHPTYGHTSGTVMNGLLWRARDWPAGTRPSLVGRLDKLTSGALLVAKTRAVHAALQKVMVSPRSEKEYLALVYGVVKPVRGSIDLKLARDPRDRRRVIASTKIGVNSLTRYEQVATVQASPLALSLLKCRLVTGRMHQIRVHLAARGWPLVGDPQYGEARSLAVDDPGLAVALGGLHRQALHASRVSLLHPFTGKPLVVAAPLPAELEELFRLLGFPT